MNKLVATSLDKCFHVYDMRTQVGEAPTPLAALSTRKGRANHTRVHFFSSLPPHAILLQHEHDGFAVMTEKVREKLGMGWAKAAHERMCA